jgi:hypothetical protein
MQNSFTYDHMYSQLYLFTSSYQAQMSEPVSAPPDIIKDTENLVELDDLLSVVNIMTSALVEFHLYLRLHLLVNCIVIFRNCLGGYFVA